MRKLLLLLGVATTLAANAATPTLTQDWKYTTDLPGVDDARWGVGKDGKVYTNDKSTKTVYYWDAEGKHTLGTGASSTGISIDDAGNLLISDGWAGGGAVRKWVIIPAGSTTPKAVSVADVDFPANFTAARMDYVGRTAGNIMSAEGGAIFLSTSGCAYAAKFVFANGSYVKDKSKSYAYNTDVAGGTDGSFQPLTSDANSDEFIGKATRSNSNYLKWDSTNNKWVAITKAEGQNTTAGADFVLMNGELIGVVSSGTNYTDCFSVVNEAGEVLATHDTSVTGKQGYPNALSIEKVNDNTCAIYQFVPGQMVAKYTLTFPVEDNTPAKMFVLGETSGKGWDPTQGIELTKTAPGVYTGSVTFDKVGCYIAFTEDLAANNDQGGWDYVNGIRYSTNDGAAYRTMGSALAVSKQNASFRIDRKGTFTVTLDLNAGTVKFEGEAYTPAALRIVGAVSTIKTLDPWELEAHDWDPKSNLLVATKAADAATYDFTGIVFNNEANQEFCFADGTATAWDTSDGTPSVNAFRYGHDAIDGEKVLLGSKGDTKELQGTQTCFCAVYGAQYAFHVDLDALTVTAEGYSGIQNNLIKAANVAVGQGAIYVLEGNNTSIYNTMGQTVVANSTAKTFNVSAGLYIVNVDGKTTKVLVR